MGFLNTSPIMTIMKKLQITELRFDGIGRFVKMMKWVNMRMELGFFHDHVIIWIRIRIDASEYSLLDNKEWILQWHPVQSLSTTSLPQTPESYSVKCEVTKTAEIFCIFSGTKSPCTTFQLWLQCPTESGWVCVSKCTSSSRTALFYPRFFLTISWYQSKERSSICRLG